jgi:hypothetical protein
LAAVIDKAGTRVFRGVLVVAGLYAATQIAVFYLDYPRGRHRVETAWLIVVSLSVVVAGFGRRRAPRSAAGTAPVAPPSAAWCAALMASALLLYVPALTIGLLADDFVHLARPVTEAMSPGAWQFYRPLPVVVWKLLHAGGGPVALHGLNVALHGANAWLLLRLAVRLGAGRELAWLSVALFLFFPASVEAVAWASGIFDVALVFFGLIFLNAALAPGRAALALAALAAALLTKETAVALPAIALLLWFRSPQDRRVIAGSFLLVTAYVLTRTAAGIEFPPPAKAGFQYLAKEALARPFASLSTPWTAAEIRQHPAALGLLPAVMLLSVVITRATGTCSPLRLLGSAGWTVLATLPLLGAFFVADDLRGSRYLYLPLCGWSLLIADLLDVRPPGLRKALAWTAGGLAVAIGTLGVRAHLRPWTEAAAARDRIVISARSAIASADCSTIAFEKVPESLNGAYVFVNGLHEALGLDSEVGPSTRSPACSLVWTGQGFRVDYRSTAPPGAPVGQ